MLLSSSDVNYSCLKSFQIKKKALKSNNINFFASVRNIAKVIMYFKFM